MPTSAAAQTASDQSVIYLDQGWSQDDRDWYYHFSQGSAVLSYDIYLNLERRQPGTAPVRRATACSPDRDPYNPDGLPIGISKTTVATPIKGWPAGDYAGVTARPATKGS